MATEVTHSQSESDLTGSNSRLVTMTVSGDELFGKVSDAAAMGQLDRNHRLLVSPLDDTSSPSHFPNAIGSTETIIHKSCGSNLPVVKSELYKGESVAISDSVVDNEAMFDFNQTRSLQRTDCISDSVMDDKAKSDFNRTSSLQRTQCISDSVVDKEATSDVSRTGAAALVASYDMKVPQVLDTSALSTVIPDDRLLAFADVEETNFSLQNPLLSTSCHLLVEARHCHWMHCQQAFDSVDALVNHVNETHVKMEGDVVYRCRWENCLRNGKGFNARYKMLIHVRTHTHEKPHRCTMCGKCFSRLENLKIHHRSHTGEKPYICPFVGCHKAYSNSSDRFKHVRTHQVDKPYDCKTPGCSKRYTDPSSLRKHMKIHGHYTQRLIRRMNGDVTTATECDDATSHMTGSSSDDLSHSQVMMSLSGAHTPSLASNPLLSSTMSHMTATQNQGTMRTIMTTLELPSKELSDDEEGKTQDRPLNLSTSPLSSHGEDDNSNDSCHATQMVLPSRWQLVTTE